MMLIKNTRFYKLSSGPEITRLLQGYAKMSSKTSRIGGDVLGESNI